ncbi:lipopolysaccharide assembly protein LapB [Porphyromonas sp.]|uniref:tetratricopeptide repeat protein n=1 Tax=Porphyromonas sp. TaxID=1924944 RepID=UPI0026DBE475|nr:tetratricopeptide repeat protein [Porphyromonas sp.]MDO4771317.1 tetratricopeptide repeat protein [Porphyromonas sp.]
MERDLHTALDFILDYRLLDGMTTLEGCALPEIKDHLETIRDNYTYLSDYFVKGVDDPQRSHILEDMRKSLAQLVYRNEVIRLSKYAYYVPSHHIPVEGDASPILSLIKMWQLPREDESDMDYKRYFAVLETLFDKLWSAPALTDEEVSAIRYTMTDGDNTFVARVLVNALALGLLPGIEPAKYLLLTEACGHRDLSVRETALSALMMISKMYDKVLGALYPGLIEKSRQVFALADGEEVYAACNAIYSSYRTEEDHRIFVERVEPQLNDIAQKMNFMQGGDLLERLKNAEKTGEASDIERTILDIQEELPRDRDLTFHTIQKMKGYPFFDSIPRFFLPFDVHHPTLNLDNATAFEKLLPMTFREGMICSSDCYSFASIEYWKQFSEMLAGNIPDLSSSQIAKDADYYAKDFVFGLYRFIKLCSWGSLFSDPFEDHLNILESSGTRSLISSPEPMRRIIERLVALKEYDLVTRLGQDFLSVSGIKDPQVHRILAVVYYRSKDYDMARAHLEAVVECEGLTAPIAMRLGELYEMAGRPQEALSLYTKAYEEHPDEPKVALDYARLLEIGGDYAEASKVAFGAFFNTDGKDADIVLLLVRSLLMMGKLREASERIAELSDDNDEAFVYKQFIRLIQGDREGAVDTLARWSKDITSRVSFVHKHAEKLLPKHNWTKSDIILLIDALKISISKL